MPQPSATLLTGILPGLLIASIVYKATGRQPFDLFKGEGERFTQELELVKGQNKSHATFFKPAVQRNDEGQDIQGCFSLTLSPPDKGEGIYNPLYHFNNGITLE